jgi:glucosamine--fructose-6-phosphate aminotransferase (isomerizing)
MNKFVQYGLGRDMLETVDVIRNFSCERPELVAAIRDASRVMYSGEGSSRLFPSKHAIKVALQRGYQKTRHTEGGVQAQSYDLSKWAVIGVSNSGRTAEVIGLFKQLKATPRDVSNRLICVIASEGR